MEFTYQACEDVAGNLVAGKLLRHIMRWFNFTKIVRDGHKWIALTRQEWADEAHLSFGQVKRALTHLSKAGLIVREQHLRGSLVDALNVLYLRPTDDCLRSIEEHGVEQKRATQVARKRTGRVEQKRATHLYNHQNQPLKNNPSATSFAVAVSESPKALPETNLHEEKSEILGASPENANVCNSHGGEMVTAAEVQAKFKVCKPINAAALKPDKFRSLELVWKVECARRGMVTFEFTQKARGQLRQLLTRLPKEGTAPPVFLSRVIRQWADFVLKAERDHGAFNSPRQPNLAYLLKFIEAGVHLKDEEPPKPKETQTVARPKLAKPQKELPRKMTAEETLAALAEPLDCEILADQRSKEARVYQGIRR